ncbi:MAG: DeoR/GlpR family DNA-binding transcription regulator [Clostridiaceae bacterium]
MKIDRLNEMEACIKKSGAISLQELCRCFHVSLSTVRRDVSELIQRNRIQKIYGGVIRGSLTTADETPHVWNADLCPAGSHTGFLAASLVREGMSVFLDSGAAALELLPYLAEKRDITVISNSLMALKQAALYHTLNVIALGGIFNSGTSSFSGQAALDELAKMSIDLVFLTADGVTLERGLTSSNYTEIDVKKNVAKWNRDLVLLADGSAFGKSALITFCELARLKAIVCDRPLPNEFLRAGALHKITVLTPTTEFEAAQEEPALERIYAVNR